MRGTENPGGELERLAQIEKLKAIIPEMVKQVCNFITAASVFPWITEYIQLAFDDQMEGIKELPEDEYIEAVVTMSLRMADVGMTMAEYTEAVAELALLADLAVAEDTPVGMSMAECAETFAEMADLAVADDEPRRKKPPRPEAVIGPRPRTTVPSRYLEQARRCKRLPRAGMKHPL